MSLPEPGFPALGRIVIHGAVTARTGLHIGALRAAIRTRGIDAPVVTRFAFSADKRDNQEQLSIRPYIPGSSLRGKLRSLLERKVVATTRVTDFFREVATAGKRPIRIHTCQEKDCPVCRLFGNVPLKSEKGSRPASVYFFDLDKSTDSGNRDSLTETKFENCLDRTTNASNPRQIERVPPGTEFSLKISYWVRDPEFVKEDLSNLFALLELLEDDSLGGHGTRGYGAVKVRITEIRSRRFGEDAEEIIHDLGRGVNSAIAGCSELFGKPRKPEAVVLKSNMQSLISLVKLHFLSPLHIGEVGIGVEECAKNYIPSDTLFSAICNAWALTYGKQAVDDLIKQFCTQSPPFRISSAFPYCKDVLFFPKPKCRPTLDDDRQEALETGRKKLKDLSFLPTELFVKWLKQALDLKEMKDLETADDLLRKIATTELLPKVRLDRIEKTSNLFFCGLTHFAPNSGLFFLVKGPESAFRQLKKVMEILGEIGIGGERSAGCGQFKVEWIEDALTIDGLKEIFTDGLPPLSYCTLSLYYPRSDEFSDLKKKLQGYEFVERGGWIESSFVASGIQKRRCRMINEGSLLTFPASGQLVNVTPKQRTFSHEVYRYGLAFPVGAG